MTIIDTSSKIAAFLSKLEMWEKLINHGESSPFPTFENFTKEDLHLRTEVTPIIETHLTNLKKKLFHYFDNKTCDQFQWVVSPFTVSAADVSVHPVAVAEELLDLSSDIALKTSFPTTPLATFWSRLLPQYPTAAAYAVKLLIPFASTWSCETAFSALTAVKVKTRNRLQVENDIRLALTDNPSPRIDTLCGKLQCQPSH